MADFERTGASTNLNIVGITAFEKTGASINLNIVGITSFETAGAASNFSITGTTSFEKTGASTNFQIYDFNTVLAATPVNDSFNIFKNDSPATLNVLNNDLFIVGGETITITTPPTQGAAVVNGSVIEYTPTLNYVGLDSLQYDINSSGNPATVNIDVQDLNNLVDDNASTPMGAPVNIPVTGNDNLPFPGTLVIATPPVSGSAVVNVDGISIDYTPAADFAGADPFTYDISPSNGAATINMNVTQTIANDTATVIEGLTVNIDVLDNDIVSTASILSIDTQGTLGNASVDIDDTITYTSAGGVGTDTFTYNIGGDIGQVQVTISGGVQSDTFTVATDSVNNILDVQANDSLSGTVSIVTQPANGVAVLNGNDIDYTPTTSFVGTDSMSYEVSGLFAIITINVEAPLPVAVDDGTFTTAVNTPINIDVLANDTVL